MKNIKVCIYYTMRIVPEHIGRHGFSSSISDSKVRQVSTDR